MPTKKKTQVQSCSVQSHITTKNKHLLQCHGITKTLQLKLDRIKRSEILKATKQSWFNKKTSCLQNKPKCDFPDCDFEASYYQLKNHKLSLHPSIMPYKCDIPRCNYSSNRPNHLRSHMDHGHRIFVRHPCKYDNCDFKSKTKSVLKRHLIKEHNEKPYKCHQCNLGFTSNYILNTHVRRNHAQKVMSCPYWKCKLKFLSPSEVKQHLMTHTGEKPNRKVTCGWKTNRSGHLQLHVQTDEDEETQMAFRKFKCNLCEYSSNQSSNLNSHIRGHLGEKAFKCSLCNFRGLTGSTVKIHMLTHGNLKAYKCAFCKFACNTNSELERHIRRHTGEKPYKCSYCDFSAVDRSDVKKHEVVNHNNGTRQRKWACPLCPKWFFSKAGMETHVRTHTGEKPYNCKFCKRDFSMSGPRNQHERCCKMCPESKGIRFNYGTKDVRQNKR